MIFTYSPLPDTVHLMDSNIHGFGIFAKDFLREGEIIGISHVMDENKTGLFNNNLIRTALGGFLNHADKPNCILLTNRREWYLATIMEIFPNQELTVDYQLYACGNI